MKKYLEDLITEKGVDLDTEVKIEGHYGLTYQMLVDFIVEAKEHHREIRNTLVKIDFHNGDVFHYLNYLTRGMLKSMGFLIEIMNQES